MLLQAVHDATLYREGLMRSETIREEERADYEEYYVCLTQFLAFLKGEYERYEDEIGVPMERLNV